MRHVAELRRGHAGRGVRHRVVLRDVPLRADRQVPDQHLRHDVVRAHGRRCVMHHAEHTLGVKAGSTTDDGLITLQHAECQAACTEAPTLQVNYRHRYRVTHESFDQLVDDLRAGRLDARDPAARHARSQPSADPRRPRGRRAPPRRRPRRARPGSREPHMMPVSSIVSYKDHAFPQLLSKKVHSEYPWATGFYPAESGSDRPAVVTSRFPVRGCPHASSSVTRPAGTRV